MMTIDPTLARPHHLLPHIPARPRGDLPLGRETLGHVIDAALPYGRRLLLLRRYLKLSRGGLRVA